MTPPLRSLLFCPATAPRPLAKLPFVGADAVAIDLEDAVTNSRKVDARSELREALERFGEVRTYVRVNHPSTGLTEGDIHGIMHPNLDGIVLPKVESPETVRDAAGWLTAAEQAQGLEQGRTAMLLLIESALGIHRAVEILAANDRVETGIFGFVDFMLDLGMDVIDTSESADELLLPRSSLVLAARVAGRRPPLDGPFIDISAGERFLAQCIQARSAWLRGQDADPPLAGRAHAPRVRADRRGSRAGAPRRRAVHRGRGERRRGDRRRRPPGRLPGDDARATDRGCVRAGRRGRRIPSRRSSRRR